MSTEREPLFRKADVGLRPHLKDMAVQARAAVYLAILTRTGKEGFCFPSVQQIAEDCGINEKTARRALDWLCEERGLIEREWRSGTSPMYRPRRVTIEGIIIGAPNPSHTVAPLPQNGTPATEWYPSHGVAPHSFHGLVPHLSHAVGDEGKEQEGLEQEGREQQGAATPPGPSVSNLAGESGVQTQTVAGSTSATQTVPASADGFTQTSATPNATAPQGPAARDNSGPQNRPQRKAATPNAATRQRRGHRAWIAEQGDAEAMQKAAKSAKHMEAFLLYGKAGVDAFDNGASEDDLLRLPPAQTNWRQFFVRDAEGRFIVDDGRPRGIETFSVPAWIGYYWWLVTNYLAARNAPIYTPNWGRLASTLKSQLANYGPVNLFDRIVAYGQSYDGIMSTVGKPNDLPGEDSLTNSLVERAYRQWQALGDYEKQEAVSQVRQAA